MKKKGFTLIELLAVIVILAIIALIATPIVLNIINDTKESAILRSADFYVDALESEIALENMKVGGSFNPSICEISNGVISCDNKEINLKVDGEVPTSGSITFEDGKVTSVNLTYPSGNVTLNNKGELVLGDTNVPASKSFAEDSWDTIVKNVRTGNLSKYNVGDTKEIALTGFTNTETDSNGLYTIRIANTSTLSECSNEGYSQTACGFVIEFVDIITNAKMNSTVTNAGGWESSLMRSYVNTDILNSFPEELKTNIIDTYVVSGHESDKTKNYKTTDKIYLLSIKEVYGKEATSNQIDNGLGETETRQLDYYKSIGVTTSNYSGAMKNNWWWLRSAPTNFAYGFYHVDNVYAYNGYDADYPAGVSVAFRIG